MERKHYEKPVTVHTTVEVENGFMAASIYEKPENTELLNIDSQKVDTDHVFDFSNEDTWTN